MNSTMMGTITVQPDCDIDPSLWFINKDEKIEQNGSLYPIIPYKWLPPILPSKKNKRTILHHRKQRKKYRTNTGKKNSNLNKRTHFSSVYKEKPSFKTTKHNTKHEINPISKTLSDRIVLIDEVASDYARRWDDDKHREAVERRRAKREALGIRETTDNPYIDNYGSTVNRFHNTNDNLENETLRQHSNTIEKVLREKVGMTTIEVDKVLNSLTLNGGCNNLIDIITTYHGNAHRNQRDNHTHIISTAAGNTTSHTLLPTLVKYKPEVSHQKAQSTTRRYIRPNGRYTHTQRTNTFPNFEISDEPLKIHKKEQKSLKFTTNSLKYKSPYKGLGT